jgi:hypothetical protein
MPLPTLASGVFRSIVISPETTFGTAGGGPGQLLRRAQADLNLDVTPMVSPEIITSQQVRDVRNGPRRVRGSINGVLAPAAYKDFFDNLMRGTWTAGVVKASVTDVAGSVSGLGNQTLTSASVGAWVVSGFKRGDIVRPTNFTSAPAALNGTNFRISSVTSTVLIMNPMANQTPLTWTASTQSPTLTVIGKKLTIPASGAVKRGFTLESWFGDISVSNLYTGCRGQQMTLNFPANNFVQMQYGLMGLDMTRANSRTYASPTALNSNASLTMVGGRVAYAGQEVAYVTSASLQIAANLQADVVVGDDSVPEIFQGTIQVRGSISVFMTDDTMMADFLSETDVELAFTATASPSASADFISFYMPRVRLMNPTMQDGDTGMIRTFNFQALEMVSSITNTDLTSLVVQDSLA